jgi:hypothetical protein
MKMADVEFDDLRQERSRGARLIIEAVPGVNFEAEAAP